MFSEQQQYWSSSPVGSRALAKEEKRNKEKHAPSNADDLIRRRLTVSNNATVIVS